MDSMSMLSQNTDVRSKRVPKVRSASIVPLLEHPLPMMLRSAFVRSSDSFNARFIIAILIVDDSAINCTILKKLVQKYFASNPKMCSLTLDIKGADDGTTALSSVSKFYCESGRHFDLILMDNCMMEMHGPETARKIKSIQNFHGHIIGVTGHVMPDQISDFLEHGADVVLQKPVKMAELGLYMSKYLGICPPVEELTSQGTISKPQLGSQE